MTSGNLTDLQDISTPAAGHQPDAPSAAAVNVTLLCPRGGYRPLGLGWTRPFGFRVHCWDRPGVGRVGLFLPAGVSGALPARVQLRGDLGRLGSGVLVPGVRAVILTFDAFPADGWFDVLIPEGVPLRSVMARSTRNSATAQRHG